MNKQFRFKEWAANDELPIKKFSISTVMSILSQNRLSLGLPKSKFINEMQWGEMPGAVRLQWTPRLNIKIQKLHTDLLGKNVWILKKYYFVNDKDFAGHEDIVANEIAEEIREVTESGLDSVLESKEFKLHDIVYSLVAKVRNNHKTINFQNVKKLSENQYDLSFTLTGAGQGTMYGPKSQRPALSLVIKMAYLEHQGIIKVITELIQGVDNTINWTIQPAEFEEHFMPTQNKNEIIQCITTALSWF